MIAEAYKLRTPCQSCGSETGRLETRGNQDCVFCECGKYQYCAPKTETGRAVRKSTNDRKQFKPKKRARILERDGGMCKLCGAAPTIENPLEVGHIVSVKQGREFGLTDEELNDDENLLSMCKACNSGFSERTLPLGLLVRVLTIRVRANQ